MSIIFGGASNGVTRVFLGDFGLAGFKATGVGVELRQARFDWGTSFPRKSIELVSIELVVRYGVWKRSINGLDLDSVDVDGVTVDTFGEDFVSVDLFIGGFVDVNPTIG